MPNILPISTPTMIASSASFGGEAGIDYDGDLYISREYTLNNAGGVAGPDNRMGGMPGQPGNMNGQMGGQPGGR